MSHRPLVQPSPSWAVGYLAEASHSEDSWYAALRLGDHLAALGRIAPEQYLDAAPNVAAAEAALAAVPPGSELALLSKLDLFLWCWERHVLTEPPSDAEKAAVLACVQANLR